MTCVACAQITTRYTNQKSILSPDIISVNDTRTNKTWRHKITKPQVNDIGHVQRAILIPECLELRV